MLQIGIEINCEINKLSGEKNLELVRQPIKNMFLASKWAMGGCGTSIIIIIIIIIINSGISSTVVHTNRQ